MIIFLYGQNSYSLVQYVNELINRYRKKYPASFNLHRFDLEEDDPVEIRKVVKGVSFFKEIKFTVVKNLFAQPDFIEKIIKESGAAKDKETVLLFYQAQSEEEIKKKNKKLFSLLAKEAQTKEFKPPTIQAAAKFVAAYLAKQKITIKKETLNKLLKETKTDLWRIENELKKVAAYLKQAVPEAEPSARYGASKKTITDEELIKLVSFKIDYNIFTITDAAFFDHLKVMNLLEDYFFKGGDPSYLISMLAFQLKNLIMVRELMDKKLQYSEILKKTKIHQFVFKKNYETAKEYTLDRLKSIFQKLADFEISLKTGRGRAEDIFFKVFL